MRTFYTLGRTFQTMLFEKHLNRVVSMLNVHYTYKILIKKKVGRISMSIF